MRARLSWSLSVPLAVIGSLAGHQLGYRIAAPDPHERAHLLERSGHAYLEYGPLLVGVCLALVLLGFVSLVARRLRKVRTPSGAPILLVALFPPFAFVIQEHAERYLFHNQFQWDTLAQPAVIAGVLLQAPFALAAALVAAWLAGVAVRVANALASEPPRLIVSLETPALVAAEVTARPPVLARGYAERGPPAVS